MRKKMAAKFGRALDIEDEQEQQQPDINLSQLYSKLTVQTPAKQPPMSKVIELEPIVAESDTGTSQYLKSKSF